MKDLKTCIDCGKYPLIFESSKQNDYEEYESDPETGEIRCCVCDTKANPKRYD